MNRQDLKANSDGNTTFEFEHKTEGVDVSDGVVSFVLIDDPFNYEFICKHEQQEAERRESARRELAERQQEIIRQTQENNL